MKTSRIRSWSVRIGVVMSLACPVGLWGGDAENPAPDCGAGHQAHQWTDGAEMHAVAGTVARIDRMERNHMIGRRGMHLTLRLADKKGVRVHLCPCGELELKGMNIRKNDFIQVRGVYADVCGNRELIAWEITKNGKTVWIGGKSHPPQAR